MRPRVAIALALVAAGSSPESAAALRWAVGDGFRVRLPPAPSTSSPQARRDLAEVRALQQRRASPARWSADATETWTQLTLDQIRAHRVNPVRAARALALVSVAMNDAIQTLHASMPASARPAPCRLDARIHAAGGRCPVSASRPDTAAAGEAAALVLAELFPDQRPALRRASATALSRTMRSGTTWRSDVDAAVLVGRRIAARVAERARHDGSSAQWTGVRPTGSGLWQPTPPAFSPPLDPLAGTWRTWNLNRGSQFRPAPPPAQGTPLFDAETQQVYDTTRALTGEQRRIATFWADAAGTVTPPGHWDAIALATIRERELTPERAAFVLATLNTAQADAFIACWDAKYAYWSVRPVTVIQQWWYDPAWSPLLVTPPFPSYPSGHATTSAAAATVLGRFFPAQRAHLDRMADEAAQSRLYAGIHFASDTRAGLALGRKVAGVALRRVSHGSQQRR